MHVCSPWRGEDTKFTLLTCFASYASLLQHPVAQNHFPHQKKHPSMCAFPESEAAKPSCLWEEIVYTRMFTEDEVQGHVRGPGIAWRMSTVGDWRHSTTFSYSKILSKTYLPKQWWSEIAREYILRFGSVLLPVTVGNKYHHHLQGMGYILYPIRPIQEGSKVI